MPNELHELSDSDAEIVIKKISEMQQLGEEAAANGSSLGFRVYRTCRDIMEILTLDQVSRDTLKKLQGSYSGLFQGHNVTTAVVGFLKADQLINAIKQFRSESGLGLKEAKDWVEALREEIKKGRIG